MRGRNLTRNGAEPQVRRAAGPSGQPRSRPGSVDSSWASTTSSWCRRAILRAGAWSLAYAALAGYWALGGRGLPFGRAGDPGAELSVLGATEGPGVAAILAVAGVVGALVAVVMDRSQRTRGAGGIGLLVFAWSAVVVFGLVLPDFRLLMVVGYTPVLLAGAPFGWPEGASVADAWNWPEVHQFLWVAGGLAWGAAAVAYQRQHNDACGRCGRTARAGRWSEPEVAARWGRWATAVAVVVPLLYAATRWAWALGIPLGISEEFLREGQQSGMWVNGAALATLGIAGAGLTLGLAQRWGEVFPRWIPRLGGRRVPPRLATIPATLVAVLVTTAGITLVRLQVTGFFEGTVLGEHWAAIGPELLWPGWGAALAAATLAYHLRRQQEASRVQASGWGGTTTTGHEAWCTHC